MCVKGVDMISERAIPKIYWSAESPDFLINPVKTQNKSCQTYKVGKEGAGVLVHLHQEDFETN